MLLLLQLILHHEPCPLLPQESSINTQDLGNPMGKPIAIKDQCFGLAGPGVAEPGFLVRSSTQPCTGDQPFKYVFRDSPQRT